MYSNKVHIMDHPLVAHKLTIMRDENTSVKDFRELVSEIGMLITYEATRDLPLTTKHIKTPLCEMDAPTLAGFLEEIALYTDIEQYDAEADAVVMMTMHAAKGLEFPNVFLVGLEEGLFPSNRCMSEPEELEEERRLCYVAMTRAKEKLICVDCMSHARKRAADLAVLAEMPAPPEAAMACSAPSITAGLVPSPVKAAIPASAQAVTRMSL